MYRTNTHSNLAIGLTALTDSHKSNGGLNKPHMETFLFCANSSGLSFNAVCK